MEVTAIGSRYSIIVGEAYRMSQKCPPERHWLGVAYREVSIPFISKQPLWPSGPQMSEETEESRKSRAAPEVGFCQHKVSLTLRDCLLLAGWMRVCDRATEAPVSESVGSEQTRVAYSSQVQLPAWQEVYSLEGKAQLSSSVKGFATCCVPLLLSWIFQSTCRELNQGRSEPLRAVKAALDTVYPTL